MEKTIQSGLNKQIDRQRMQTGDKLVNSTRRDMLVSLTMLSAAVLAATHPPRARAFSFADLSQGDAGTGVKAALSQGADIAVQLLGKQDGFWGNDKVRIALPDWIEKAETALKFMGRGRDIDDLKLGINRAAEQAVPHAKRLLSDAVKSITVQDAKAILTGGDNSVTMFFKDKTQTSLTEKFLPIVTKATNKIGLARKYNDIAAQVEKTRFIRISPEQRKVENHVTAKALDGLYYMIGEEEKKSARTRWARVAKYCGGCLAL